MSDKELDVVQEAQDLLDKAENVAPFPWRVNEMTLPTDETVIATIRSNEGYPVLSVHPESSSMMTGKREIFELFVFSPRVIQGLLDRIKELETPSGVNKQASEAEK